MVPNLGWGTSVLQEKLPHLRQSIINRFKILSPKYSEESELALRTNLENEFGYFDEGFAEALRGDLENMTPQSLLNTLPPKEVSCCLINTERYSNQIYLDILFYRNTNVPRSIV
jgi:hypothetical protein